MITSRSGKETKNEITFKKDDGSCFINLYSVFCARAEETIDEPSDNEQDINEIPNNTQDTDDALDIVQEVLEEEQIQDSGVNTTADILMDGNGTPESPYLVRTPEDLDRYPL